MDALTRTSSRRWFFRRAGLASLLLPAAWSARPGARELAAPTSSSPYARLGVRPLINAAGTYTRLSASLLPPDVTAAMHEASKVYVDIPELQHAVGRRLADLLGVENALVTSGAAAALTLGTAACVAGSDPERIKRLPDVSGMKNEVIIQRSHHFAYDHAVRAVGITFVEVETREDLQRAIGPRTAMLLYFNAADPPGRISREELVAAGKAAGVPTLIDAAADVPPVGRLSEYARMGFDLVCISGGKGLRGPQCSGLLLGRTDLVEAAFLNGSPFSDSIGRAAKVGKEEIVGLLTAVELFVKRDHDAVWKDWEAQAREIVRVVGAVPAVERAETFVPEVANATPHVRIRWNEARAPGKRRDVARQLSDGDPRIEVRPSAEDQPVLEVAVWMLEPGQHAVVARRIREVLLERSGKG